MALRCDQLGAPTLFAPVLLWMAVRRGVVPTTFVATAVCVGLVLSVKAGLWPWPPAATLPLAAAVARLQLVIVLMTVPPLMVAVVIAERERARLTEAKAARRLDDALAAMADGLALIDGEGSVALCNPRFKELFRDVPTCAWRVSASRTSSARRPSTARTQARTPPTPRLGSPGTPSSLGHGSRARSWSERGRREASGLSSTIGICCQLCSR